MRKKMEKIDAALFSSLEPTERLGLVGGITVLFTNIPTFVSGRPDLDRDVLNDGPV